MQKIEDFTGVEKVNSTILYILEQSFNARDCREMKARIHSILIMLYTYMNDHEKLMWKVGQSDLFEEFTLCAWIIKRTGTLDKKQLSHIYAVALSRIYTSDISLSQVYARILNCLLTPYMSADELKLFGDIGIDPDANHTLAYAVMRKAGYLIGKG